MLLAIFCLQLLSLPLPFVPCPSLVCRTWFLPLHLLFRLFRKEVPWHSAFVLIFASPNSLLLRLVTWWFHPIPRVWFNPYTILLFTDISYHMPPSGKRSTNTLCPNCPLMLTQPSPHPAFQHLGSSPRLCTDWFAHCPHPFWTKVTEVCVYQYSSSYSEVHDIHSCHKAFLL